MPATVFPLPGPVRPPGIRAHRRRICMTALLLGVSACSFAPEHVRPPQPVPQAYATATPPGDSIADLGWRDFFREAELQRLIDLALANNRDIRVATTRLAEARAAWRIEGASL